MREKKLGGFVFVAACVVVGLWLLKRSGGHQESAQTEDTAEESVADSLGMDSPGIQILSESLTPTGRVYQILNNGLTNTVTVPESWQLTPEQLETMTLEAGTEEPRERPVPGARNRQLVFFGLALDEKTNAVANAQVEADVMVGRPNQTLKREIVRASTDADGRFELRVEWGQQAMVTLAASTNDYINPESQWFQFGPVGNRPIHRPDHLNPVVFWFQTRQKQEPLFEFTKGYRIPNDGTPVRVDLTTGDLVPTDGDLIVTLDAVEPYTNMRPFPWTVGVQVVDGGLQETGGLGTRMEHLHEAPSDGYEAGFLLNYGPTSPSYRRQHDGWYFVRSRNGLIHAKLYFSCNARWDERGIAFGLRAVVNTNGSRYLHTEPK